MIKFISFLDKNKWLNVLIALIYYILVVTTHRQVGRFVAQNLDKPLGRDNYNLLVIALGTLLFVGTILLLQKNFRTSLNAIEKRRILFYLSSLILLIVAAVNVIMVVNVEIIHILQYCVMALILFPIIRDFNTVMICTTLLGALDEAYQYWYLFPEKSDYFDFNDVIINFLGVILGLIILRSQGFKSTLKEKAWYKTTTFYIIFSVVLLTLIGLYTGLISADAPGKSYSHAFIELVRKHKPGFWRIIPPQVKFHVIRPLEFVGLISFLFVFYRKIGK